MKNFSKRIIYKPLYNDTLEYYDDFKKYGTNCICLVKKIYTKFNCIGNTNLYLFEKKLKDEINNIEKSGASDLITMFMGICGVLVGFYISQMSELKLKVIDDSKIIYRIVSESQNKKILDFVPLSFTIFIVLILFFAIGIYSILSQRCLRYYYYQLGILEDFKEYGVLGYEDKYKDKNN